MFEEADTCKRDYHIGSATDRPSLRVAMDSGGWLARSRAYVAARAVASDPPGPDHVNGFGFTNFDRLTGNSTQTGVLATHSPRRTGPEREGTGTIFIF
jgi:hypothetical protein